MSFSRPTLTDIDRRVRADIEAGMPEVPVVRRGSVLAALARGLAGATHSVFGFGDWIFRQIFPDTADSANLERQAGFHGILRGDAARATGEVSLTGADGTVIPSGTLLSGGDGIELRTTEDTVIAAGVATVPVEAAEVGAAGNLEDGEAVTLQSPVTGVDSAGAVTSPGMALGADRETDARLLQRLLLKLREPAHGGNAADYIQWALAVAGVTRVWVAGSEAGLGTVVVRFVVDDAPHGPVPTAGEVAAVQDAIDAVRPVTADVRVLAPALLSQDIELSVTPDTAEVRTAVEAELAALFLTEGAPGVRIYRTHVAEAISRAAGEVDHGLVTPAGDIVPGAGEMPVLGSVTFQ